MPDRKIGDMTFEEFFERMGSCAGTCPMAPLFPPEDVQRIRDMIEERGEGSFSKGVAGLRDDHEWVAECREQADEIKLNHKWVSKKRREEESGSVLVKHTLIRWVIPSGLTVVAISLFEYVKIKLGGQ